MRKLEETVGTPFTRRRKVSHRTETAEEMADALRDMARRLQDPWGQQRPIRDWIDGALEVEMAAKPDGYQFRERVDSGWYLRELQIQGKIADQNIAKGDAKWAAFAGMLFGELWAELQLKLAREDLFIVGKRAKDHSEEGAAARRKATPEERKAAVDQLVARGQSKRNAFRLVAKREGSSAKTIEKDYYAK